MSIQNIQSGFRATGLWPIEIETVLRHLELTPASLRFPQTPSQQSVTPFDALLLTTSPLDADTLHSANKALNNILEKIALPTPAKKPFDARPATLRISMLSAQYFDRRIIY